MIDIIETNSSGVTIADTQIHRATNILSVQIGSLEYAPSVGIDLRFFLNENLKFQNESFKSYLIEVLANHGITVYSIAEALETLAAYYNINLSPEDSSTGMMAR
jgi:hypothetical protein